MASSTTGDVDHISEILEYYQAASGPESPVRFQNLDVAANLHSSIAAVQCNKTRSSVVDFSDDASWVCLDLPPSTAATLLDLERPEILNVRWINLWYPSIQRSLIELLAKRFDFSPRLLALMCSDPLPSGRPSQSTTSRKHATYRKSWRRRKDITTTDTQIEKGLELDELSEHSSVSSYDSARALNLFEIVNDIWHYSSIDYGRNYICIGYNSLYGTKHNGDSPGGGLLSHCTRVWTWLVLCEDNTVISINEDPFPSTEGVLDHRQQRILAETRRNIVNILRALSKAEVNPSTSYPPMALLPLRARLGSSPEETAHRPTDVPGLLFYYLFENWHNSYTLITRRESRYSVELNKLRAEMFDLPKLHHIDRLDCLGKELNILKRHYESYNRLIDRLLEPQTATSASLQNSRVASNGSQTSFDTVRPLVTEKQSLLGVSISSAARVRFQRLRDLIDLYALSEVEDYIKQKDALVTLNFNLIAIKESLDVERLTRVTLLLTKLTFLFLPVSLMVAYFSVPLVGFVYTAEKFWISFAVTFALSLAALFVFGLVSGTVQTLSFWRGLGHSFEGVLRWFSNGL